MYSMKESDNFSKFPNRKTAKFCSEKQTSIRIFLFKIYPVGRKERNRGIEDALKKPPMILFFLFK